MRVVVPREVAEDLSSVRLNTRTDTRKVAEIGTCSRVSLLWEDRRQRGGWLVLKGTAEIVSTGGQGGSERVDIVVDVQRLE
eukprot:3008860-Alexandrium_andersonii.AAC.1